MASTALMTNVGRNKEAAALAAGTALSIAEIAWGDGNRVPSGGEISLLNEQGRKAVQGSGAVNGALNTAFFEILLDTAEGPYVIREAGLFDSDGDMIAICYYDPPVNKPKDTVTALMRIHVVFSDLQNLILQVQSTNAFVPVERLIGAGAGLTGGGDMSANRVLAVDFASNAEVLAGVLADKSISPAGLKARIDALLDGAPAALDTFKEFADALGDDPNFAATILGRLNNPVIQTNAGGGTLLLPSFSWVTVPNGQVTIGQSGKYQVVGTFRLLAHVGHTHNLQHWEARITKNNVEARWIFGNNADQTGQSNQDGTVTALTFLDLDAGDVLRHEFAGNVTQAVNATYNVTFDLIRIGDRS